MNPYLAKLRARDQEARQPQTSSKPSKPIDPVVTHVDTSAQGSFEGFEGDRDRLPSGNEAATKTVEQFLFDRHRRALEHLGSHCPGLIPKERWQQALQDGRRFLSQWGGEAAALGWTTRDLFGLAPVLHEARPAYERLSRYDETGLIWLLRGRTVLGLTESTASIESPTGMVTVYRKHHKPALGPLGDSLEDFK
jgi:hypothetical protein